MSRSFLYLLMAGVCLLLGSQCSRKSRLPAIDLQANQAKAEAAILRYAETAYTSYRTAWQKAELLRAHAVAFVEAPSAKGLVELREDWATAHNAFRRTDAFRFTGGPIAETGLYERIAAWPVTPELIDTVPGNLRSGIVQQIAMLQNLTVDGLAEMHDPSKGAVFLGFHALEFLIYGIDSYDDGAGSRAFSDYTIAKNAKRRGDYLVLLATELVANLRKLADAWNPGGQATYRQNFLELSPVDAMHQILGGLAQQCATGLDGKLTKALRTKEGEDEVCQFSDTSLDAIRNTIFGMQDVLLGVAPSRDLVGEEQPMLNLIAESDPEAAKGLKQGLYDIRARLAALQEPYDQLIKSDNDEGRASLQAISELLTKQAALFEKAMTAFRKS